MGKVLRLETLNKRQHGRLAHQSERAIFPWTAGVPAGSPVAVHALDHEVVGVVLDFARWTASLAGARPALSVVGHPLTAQARRGRSAVVTQDAPDMKANAVRASHRCFD